MDAHPFAHLGPAPYTYTGADDAFESTGRATAGILSAQETKRGGSCDHCGTAITDMYHFVAANGRKFKVGWKCAEKAGMDACGSDVCPQARKLARDRKDLQARKRGALAGRKRAEIEAALADENVRAKLAAQPSPNGYRAEKGETLLDWCVWMHANAGAKGRSKVLAAIVEASS
ncbi:MAG TPA: hypothetical protein VJP45_00190 [Candidatus Limnocylindria bacterium]|nr:hypothetical protein [Candidatus Limnocylindria bacterium]